MVISGDIVPYRGQERIVVDVATDEAGAWAILREPDDLELRRPVAVPADSLEATGHLDHLDGWVEDEPGVWRQE
jgi:hypothetical protein